MQEQSLLANPRGDTLPDGTAYLRAIFTHCHDAIFVLDPPNDKILSVNPRACAMLGYSREELLARPISQIHQRDMPSLLAFVQSVLDQGHGRTNELTCLTRTGQKIPTETSASVIETKDGRCIVAMVRDISERKRTEEELRENEERLSSILDTAMDAIVTVDENRRVTLFNKSAEQVFRCPASSVVGQSLDPFRTDVSRQFLREQLAGDDPKSSTARQLWAPKGLTFRRADGQEFPAEASVSGLWARGHSLHTLILRDVH